MLHFQTHEYAFGQAPGCEAHGGSTFCAVASLSLMGKLDTFFTKKERDFLIRWLLMKQVIGFCGRPNKDEDSCYSFWIGGSLKILGCDHFINQSSNNTFINLCFDRRLGGFAKVPCDLSDPMHTFLTLSALHLDKMDARLNVTKSSLSKLRDNKCSN